MPVYRLSLLTQPDQFISGRAGTYATMSMSLYLGIDVTHCACNVNRSTVLVKEQQKFYPR